jgi:hypothetical protein
MKYKHETVIKEGSGAFSRPYLLVHVPECDEIAGSGIRHVKECYRLVYTIGGVRNSRAYKTLEEAQTEFERVTTPIVAIEA